MSERPSVPHDAVQPGDLLVPDKHFACLDYGVPVEVRRDPRGELYVHCREGRHMLDGQLDQPGGDFVGFSASLIASGMLHRALQHRAQARADLMVAMAAQPRHRLLEGLPECPRVIAAHDRLEVWESAVAEIERRARMTGEAA